MTSQQRRSVPAIMAAAIGASSAIALAAEPTVQDMQKQIEALQAQLTELKSTQQSQLNAKDVDVTVDQVLADAQKRSQLMQVEGFTAGYSKGKFLIQSADGNFSLNPNFQMQLRHVVNYADEVEADGDEDIDHGFEIRRMKFGVGGNVFSKNVEYVFVWGTNRNGGNLVLEDAVVSYKFDDTGWSVFGGQFKDPVHHEELVSSKRQMAADRSLLNELLGGGETDRVQGVGVIYQQDALKATVVYHDGANSDNTDVFGGPDFGVSGRVEYVVMGNRKAYDDFTALGTEEDLLVIGGGADWTQNGSGDVVLHTIDAQYENPGGLGIYGAYVAQHSEDGDDDAYDWGALGQVSYLIPDSKWEVFGRYAYIDFDNADEELHEITGGVNYYLSKHSAKFTVDLTYLPNGAGGGDEGIGYVDSGEEDQFVLRSQFQLVI
jgi:hypothetical protein